MSHPADGYSGFMASIEQGSMVFRTLEELVLSERDRMIAIGWPQEEAQKIATERMLEFQKAMIWGGVRSGG